MPWVNIHLRKGTTPEFRRNVSLGIHRSMVDILKIPHDDQFHFFHEFDHDNVQMQPVAFGLRRGERVLAIQLFFNNRTPDEKARLFAAIVANLRLYADVPAEDVLLCVVETNSENWWAAGRMVDPETGYDERMTVTPSPAGSASRG
ncbi:tautomerase family protein [Amycolatopsis endophytica]|uniref:Phenylpyruvate tautomerase PptA (4-oxalocrotonate tautomerase family) n=1 Tax=Amycolatopsis endophytica TaxID=860233 RepID=A0A853B0I6_9PSEU|nr:tautomerase family protein [Amycolatopsis endophytica]NYI88301.1 phenylpyruvate tautomerase PptA (4-oxalocrotonate tautomerase family) [Amycolatopsis endophytica]